MEQTAVCTTQVVFLNCTQLTHQKVVLFPNTDVAMLKVKIFENLLTFSKGEHSLTETKPVQLVDWRQTEKFQRFSQV
jgi:hypothetical protein